MKSTAKKEILTTPGIVRGELRIKGFTFPFHTVYGLEEYRVELHLKEEDCSIYRPKSIGVEVNTGFLSLWVAITSPLDSKDRPMFVQEDIPWKDIEILWYLRNGITEQLPAAA